MTHDAHSHHWLITAAALVVVIAGMQAAKAVLVPFLLAIFLGIVCLPLLSKLIQMHFSPAMAVLTVTLSLLLAGAMLTVFAGASLADFSQNVPAYQDALQMRTQQFVDWLESLGLNISNAHLLSLLNPSAAMGMAGKLLAGLGSTLANTFFIVLAVIFLLFEATALPHKWAVIQADDGHTPSTEALETFLVNVNRYLAIKTMVSLATGTLVTLWLSILGIDYALLWGLVAFLFNFVPNIGSIIAAVPAVLLALVQIGPDAALYTAIGYLVINIIMGNVIEPRYMGRGVGLSTLIVFVSLVFWGWILGPVGMLLSVPLTMIVKLALEANAKSRWIAVMLGPDVKPPESQA